MWVKEKDKNKAQRRKQEKKGIMCPSELPKIEAASIFGILRSENTSVI